MSESILERMLEVIAEPLLLLGISGHFFSSVMGQVSKLDAVPHYILVALHQIAELFFHPVHESFWDVVASEGFHKLFPSEVSIRGTHLEEVLPLCSGPFF
jgi:hypothetical protein